MRRCCCSREGARRPGVGGRPHAEVLLGLWAGAKFAQMLYDARKVLGRFVYVDDYGVHAKRDIRACRVRQASKFLTRAVMCARPGGGATVVYRRSSAPGIR
jgi:hypothetical protein